MRILGQRQNHSTVILRNGSESDDVSQAQEHGLGKFSAIFHVLFCPERVAFFLTYISKKLNSC